MARAVWLLQEKGHRGDCCNTGAPAAAPTGHAWLCQTPGKCCRLPLRWLCSVGTVPFEAWAHLARAALTRQGGGPLPEHAPRIL